MTETKAKEAIIDINKYINKHALVERHTGLYGGHCGVLLYGGYQSYFENGECVLHDQVFDALTDRVFENINYPTQSFFFSGGLTGELWTIYNLRKLGYLDIDDHVFGFYAEVINQALLSTAKLGLFDNLHGAFGMLYYLNYSNTLQEDTLSDFLKCYRQKSYHNDVFSFYKTKANIQVEELTYNLSLSHGLAGQILILSYVLKEHPENKDLRKILEDMVLFIVKYRKESDTLSNFPSTLLELDNSPSPDPRRLAWCYGDLGTGFALFRYASQVQDKNMLEIAFKTLENAAKGRGVNQNHVLDAPLCHGTSGIMQVFHRLYFETKNELFKQAATHWKEETLKFYEVTDNIEMMGAWRHDSRSFLPSPSILEGYSGICLALLSKEYPELDPSWDGCLFLS